MSATVLYSSLIAFVLPALLLSDTERWITYERERNNGWVNRMVFRELPNETDRQRLLSIRAASSFWVPNHQVDVYVDPLYLKTFEKIFQRKSGSNTEILFIHHPEADEQFSKLRLGKKISSTPITPTASLRTVLWGERMLKLSLPKTLNGIDRSVYGLQMERAVTLSRLLSEIPEAEQIQNHFGFLKEPAAIAMKDPANPYGFIIREIPEYIKKGPNTLVSVVSFVSNPSPEVPSLLDLHLKSWSGASPTQKLQQHFISPLIKAFRFVAENYGILLEAHQQNILLELDASGYFTGRFFYRDLDGARVDVNVRNQRNLSNRLIYEVSNPEWVFQLSQIQNLNQSRIGGAETHVYEKYIKGSIISLLAQAISRSAFNQNSIRESLESAANSEMLMFRGCENLFTRFSNSNLESQSLK